MRQIFYFLVIFLTTKNVKSVVKEDDVKYYLFVNRNSYLLPNANSFDNLNKSANIFLIIHGWRQNHEKEWYDQLKNALLRKGKENNCVIEVDWSGPAGEWYGQAAINTKDVGNFIATFIRNLSENQQISLTKFHLIGHSLGGHVAGFTGKKILSLTGRKLPRITALDPAGPFFDNFLIRDDKRLSRNDAEIVVVYHTDGGKFGYLGRLGTVDIFFNGGRALQPGCPSEINQALIFCSHTRSFKFYTEALESDVNIYAWQCNNYVAFVAGLCYKNKNIEISRDLFSVQDEGEYYIQTNSKQPFFKKNIT